MRFDEPARRDQMTPVREGGAAVERVSLQLVPRLVGELAASASGIAFIHRALDAVVEEWDVREALAVVDGSPLGRQVFVAGRRAPDSPWARRLTASGRPGVYTNPALLERTTDLDTLAQLCRVAVRLDVSRYDALHDALTGLFNRRSFDELLSHAVDRSRRYGWPFSLVLIDLDNFKLLNDRHGHDAGDEVLRAVGGEMRRALRRGDVAARIGGDEFGLILPAAASGLLPGLVARLAGRVSSITTTPIGFSTGMASCPAEADSVENLRRIADLRLYEAKPR